MAAVERAPGGGRLVLWPALLKREVDTMLGAATLVSAGAVFLIAHEAADVDAAMRPIGLVMLLRRFDITFLYILAFLALLRIASRCEGDSRAGWLVPPVACGARRAEYGPALALSLFAASAIVFASGSIAFAAGIRVFGDSTEILADLPGTLGGGLLVLACVTVYSCVLALVLRRSQLTVIAAAGLIIVPYALALPHLRAGTLPPGWLYAWLASYPPPLSIPLDGRAVVHATIYAILGLITIAALSDRRAGRQP